MGFPFETADWAVVEGAMYMGAGGGAPFVYTVLSAIACAVALWVGNNKEHKLYENYK
ncbi:MAG: hypothetical protein ACR2O1_07810 [Boseongicola sp.]